MKRNVAALAVAVVAAVPLFASCSSDNPNQPQPGPSAPAPAAEAQHGPTFPECGGISDQTVGQLTQVTGLVNTAKNSVGCQWLAGGGIIGPHFSFTWFRGSPIGRERKTEELSRTRVDNINIDGHDGFVAVGSDPMAGDNLCEIGIQFQDDFIEWSVSFASQPYPDPCDVAKQLASQSIANAK
ncbi:DUF3558 domain-containing protein [Mycolicibacterium komossense]|uniref:DUF3558 domain-containing protein n=1 Tax=Mycolicibacterium komossense TaxID=1779 RepID=A0ABT3CJP4_9MYCO|nr:DUF3558 domain-containing protein [Mycolicibacterium komossense]MCV7229784.1 DUF3558 domain-containing protein [Mycolicibacterium komossense]